MPHAVVVRGATPQDYPAVRELLNDAFGNPDDESGIFARYCWAPFYLLH